jgi:hypothetical protein
MKIKNEGWECLREMGGRTKEVGGINCREENIARREY